MLVITRKANEAFQIGDECVVRILEVSPTIVKIGIETPREMNIRRTELKPNRRSCPPTVARLHGLPAALIGDDKPAA